MGDHPIIFSAPMVRALLDGRKTMTRRLLYVERTARNGLVPASAASLRGHPSPLFRPGRYPVISPWQRVAPGDRLWVREAWRFEGAGSRVSAEACRRHRPIQYRADGYVPIRWDERSPIHMPRWASRLTMTVADVWVERLQEISEEHARAEGIRLMRDGGGTFVGREGPGNLVTPWLTAKEAFADLWDSLHGAGAWERNPWVVALSFSVERRNIDQEAT